MRISHRLFTFLFAAAAIIGQRSNSQAQSSANTGSVPAQFPGGPKAFAWFLQQQVTLPEKALEEGIFGTAWISFRVGADGALSRFKALTKNPGGYLETEAIRILKSMPKWIPAKENGQAVYSDQEVPVYFPGRPQAPADIKIYDSVDVPGRFEDSVYGYGKWLDANLQFPAEAQRKNISGTVYLFFVLQPNGSPANIYVLSDKRYGAGIDEEASKMSRIIPPMIPAMVNGKPVATTVLLPLPFPHNEEHGRADAKFQLPNTYLDDARFHKRLRDHLTDASYYNGRNGFGVPATIIIR